MIISLNRFGRIPVLTAEVSLNGIMAMARSVPLVVIKNQEDGLNTSKKMIQLGKFRFIDEGQVILGRSMCYIIIHKNIRTIAAIWHRWIVRHYSSKISNIKFRMK